MSGPSTYNVNEFAVCNALKEYLVSNLPSTIPVCHSDEINEMLPAVIFIAPVDAVEMPEGSATYDCIIDVGISTSITVNRAMHIEYVGQVMDLIFNDGFLEAMNAGLAAGLFIQRAQKNEQAHNDRFRLSKDDPTTFNHVLDDGNIRGDLWRQAILFR